MNNEPLDYYLTSEVTVRRLLERTAERCKNSLSSQDKSVIRILSKCKIANLLLEELHEKNVEQLAVQLQKGGRSKATVHNYIARFSSILKHAPARLRINVTNRCVLNALDSLKTDKLIGKSKVRHRVLEDEEHQKILETCKDYEARSTKKIPYSLIYRLLRSFYSTWRFPIKIVDVCLVITTETYNPS